MLGRRVSNCWDDAAALSLRYGHLLPSALMCAAREGLERGLRPWVEQARFEGALSLMYEGADPWARADFAQRLGLSLAARPSRRIRGARMRYATLRADLGVVEITRRAGPRWRARGYLVAPRFVVASVDLRAPEHALWDGNRRRRAAWVETHCEAERLAPEVWRAEVHGAMYAPTMRARFGDAAFIARERFLDGASRGGHVLAVNRDGERLGAALIAKVAGRAHRHELCAWGVSAQGALLAESHVGEALYALAIRAARRRGERSFGLGGCHPFARDSRLRFKKRWGASFFADPHDPRCFAVRASTERGVRALGGLGLLYEDAAGALREVSDAAHGQRHTPGVVAVDRIARPEELVALARGTCPAPR